MKKNAIKVLFRKAKEHGHVRIPTGVAEIELELSKSSDGNDTYWSAIMHHRRSESLTESFWLATHPCIEGLGYLLED